MKPTKQTVCIASDELKKEGYYVPVGFIGKYGYFFTPEELNEYTANVIKQALETAVEKVRMFDSNEDCFYEDELGNCPEVYVIDNKSITNTFKETFKKFEV